MALICFKVFFGPFFWLVEYLKLLGDYYRSWLMKQQKLFQWKSLILSKRRSDGIYAFLRRKRLFWQMGWDAWQAIEIICLGGNSSKSWYFKEFSYFKRYHAARFSYYEIYSIYSAVVLMHEHIGFSMHIINEMMSRVSFIKSWDFFLDSWYMHWFRWVKGGTIKHAMQGKWPNRTRGVP